MLNLARRRAPGALDLFVRGRGVLPPGYLRTQLPRTRRAR